MPYYIKKVKEGYKVCKKEQHDKCFSNKPLSLETAQKQMKAIGMNEHKGGAKESSQTKKYVLVYRYINNKLKDFLIDSFEEEVNNNEKYKYYGYVELKKNEESEKPIKNLLKLLDKYKIPYEAITEDDGNYTISLLGEDDEKFQSEENIDLDKEFKSEKKFKEDKNKEEINKVNEERKKLKEKYPNMPLFLAKFKELAEDNVSEEDANLLVNYFLKMTDEDSVKANKFIMNLTNELIKAKKKGEKVNIDIIPKIKLYNEAKLLKESIDETKFKNEDEEEIEPDLEKALGKYKKEQLMKEVEDIIKKAENMDFKETDWGEEVKKQKQYEELVEKIELSLGKKKRKRKYKFSKYGFSLNNFKLGDLRDIVKYFKDKFTVKNYRQLNKQQLLESIEKYLNFEDNTFKLKPYEVKLGEVLKDRYYKI